MPVEPNSLARLLRLIDEALDQARTIGEEATEVADSLRRAASAASSLRGEAGPASEGLRTQELNSVNDT